MPPASRPAAGGGRWVEVGPDRLERWLAGFAARHGSTTVDAGPDRVVVTAADGARAEVEVPFPPLAGDLVAHVLRARRTGLLLVRLGGHAVGVAEGDRLVVSKVGSRPVHGRNAAGGWSQQRFARRRDGQVRVALQAAAGTAARVLVPHAASLDGVVLGGDRSAVEAVLEDPRLGPLRPLVTGRVLDVPDPRLAVLEQAVPRARAVQVRVVDPPAG
ncbi:MAG TPA: acVLRF1 family peptidyl-tRNA hydrolase [Mycobacteriales bacterium]|nr:acVLRF1 family peptidyl-tRNA hydrolase [Mycobacteriales bacterium]